MHLQKQKKAEDQGNSEREVKKSREYLRKPSDTCIVTVLYLHAGGHQIKVAAVGGAGWMEGGSVWAGAPVPPLPQLPIEEHGEGSRTGLFIHNAGSRYSRGTGPGCGRLKRVRKRATRCQKARQEKREAQIRSHWWLWLAFFSLPSGGDEGRIGRGRRRPFSASCYVPLLQPTRRSFIQKKILVIIFLKMF